MADITSILGGAYSADDRKPTDPPEMQITKSMRGLGLEPPEQIIMDGKIHRFSTNGKKGDDAGWYVIYPEGVPAGKFGCWRDNIEAKFVADIGRELSVAEQMAVARRQSEATELRRQQQVKKQKAVESVVGKIWPDMVAASKDHEYLKKKGIEPNGARVASDGRLALPIYGPDGSLNSIQYISSDGTKRFHTGASTKDGHWMVGSLDGHDGTVYIAEGFATAATIYEVTGSPCYIAYSSGNLPSIAQVVKSRHNNPIAIVGDNDEHGAGQLKAEEAARVISARCIVPPTPGDANDYYLAGEDLKALLAPPKAVESWLVQGSEFIRKQSHVTYLIKHFIPEDSLFMVHGPSGGGKTFVVLDMVMNIALGMGEWNGHKVKQAPVLYLAGEGHSGLRGRIMAWLIKNTNGNPAGLENLYISQSGLDLNTPEGLEKTLSAIDELPIKPALIIVDTLHRFLDGDENSAKDAKTMISACDYLQKRYKASVGLVHHTGNSEDAQHRARGSSAWRGALDAEFSVVPAKDGAPLELNQVKNKDGELQMTQFMTIESVRLPWLDEDNEHIWSACVVHDSEYVKPKKEPKGIVNGKKTFETAWKEFGQGECDSEGRPYLSKSAFADYLNQLLENGDIKKGTYDNYLKPAYERGPIYNLVHADIIEKVGDGWSVKEGDFASVLSISGIGK